MPRYRVKLSWSVPAEAASAEEAVAQVERLLKEHPANFITGVEDFNAPQKRSFMNRVITGK